MELFEIKMLFYSYKPKIKKDLEGTWKVLNKMFNYLNELEVKDVIHKLW